METVTPEDMSSALRNKQHFHAVHAAESDKNRETGEKCYWFFC